MPRVNELYGQALDESIDKAELRNAFCPFMKKPCDGGGNRDMARWKANEQPLSSLFDTTVGDNGDGFIPCGVCSIRFSGRSNAASPENWAICPRRLLTFECGQNVSEAQRPLVRRILQLAGFQTGDMVSAWSEISLRDSTKGFNYRLDYVLQKSGGAPVIVEIMTASTSGGNKEKLTDIKSAFCNAVLFAHGVQPDLGDSPGVNVRQVWARMASQLIVKSEAANQWGGRAIWVIQDTLLDYIRKSTGLPLDKFRSHDWTPCEINVISANLDAPEQIELYAGPIRPSGTHSGWLELLTAPGIPDKEALTKKLSPEKAVAVLEP